MTPSKLSILLGISILLTLPSTTVAADEEIASAEELARLASSQHELQAKFDAHMRSRVDAMIEDKMGRVLADRTTQLLSTQTGLAARRDQVPPPAMPAITDDRPSNAVQAAPNTTCKMVGRTFECVFRDVTSR